MTKAVLNETPNTAQEAAKAQQPAGELVKDLIDNITGIIRGEIQLAKAETSEQITKAKAGIGGILTGAVLALGGFIALVAAACFGLATVVDLWLACLIVGGITLLIGYVMIKSGASQLEPSAFKPTCTQENIERDMRVVKESA